MRGRRGIGWLACSSTDRRPVAPEPTYQGLWWRSPAGSESGWGINIAAPGRHPVCDLVHVRPRRQPFVAGDAEWRQGRRAEPTRARSTGRTGPCVQRDRRRIRHRYAVARSGDRHLHVQRRGQRDRSRYTVNGQTQAKPITREIFATPVRALRRLPVGTKASASLPGHLLEASAGGLESGWGVNVGAPGRKDLRHVVHLRRERSWHLVRHARQRSRQRVGHPQGRRDPLSHAGSRIQRGALGSHASHDGGGCVRLSSISTGRSRPFAIPSTGSRRKSGLRARRTRIRRPTAGEIRQHARPLGLAILHRHPARGPRARRRAHGARAMAAHHARQARRDARPRRIRSSPSRSCVSSPTTFPARS